MRTTAAGVVVLGMLLALQGLAAADSRQPGGSFTDDDLNTHEAMIEAIFAQGITLGCGDDVYCPGLGVSRAQAAAFVTRSFDLPVTAENYFLDDNGNIHESDINRAAEAGVMSGFADGTFRPDLTLTRAQMASVLARAMDLDPVADNAFSDVSGVHAGSINAVFAAGVTFGCDPSGTLFCPTDVVLRDQLASFLGRALGLEPLAPPVRLAGNIIVAHDDGVSVIVGFRIVSVISGVDVERAMHDGHGGVIYQLDGDFKQILHQPVGTTESTVLVDAGEIEVILLASGNDEVGGEYFVVLHDSRPRGQPDNLAFYDMAIEVVYLYEDVSVVVIEQQCQGDRFSNYCSIAMHVSAQGNTLMMHSTSDENTWHTVYTTDGSLVAEDFLRWTCCDDIYAGAVLAPDGQAVITRGPLSNLATTFDLGETWIAEVESVVPYRDAPEGDVYFDWDGETIVLGAATDRQIITVDAATGDQTAFSIWGNPVFGYGP